MTLGEEFGSYCHNVQTKNLQMFKTIVTRKEHGLEHL